MECIEPGTIRKRSQNEFCIDAFVEENRLHPPPSARTVRNVADLSPCPGPKRAAVGPSSKVLGDTDQRLEELTAGEVDTVTDREGRSFMLRRAQERWRERGAEQQAAILDALPAHIALLDVQGTIISVNEAWRQFADVNALRDDNYAVGRNYLTLCDAAVGHQASDARLVAAGIRSVIAEATPRFSFEYRCDSLVEKRWFLVTVTPINDELSVGAVVMHLDITGSKRNEEELRRFAAAIDASPDRILLIDREEMAIVHVNEAACRLHNLSREQVFEVRPWEFVKCSREDMERTCDGIDQERRLRRTLGIAVVSGQFAACLDRDSAPRALQGDR